MNHLQQAATLGLISALTSVSPVIAAVAGSALAHRSGSPEPVQTGNTQPMTLGLEQLDQVTAGFTDDLPRTLYQACYEGNCTAYLSDGRYIAWQDESKGSWFRDSSGTTYGR